VNVGALSGFLAVALVALGACATNDEAETFPPGIGPGGPLDGGSEATKTKADGAPLDDDGATAGEPAVCTTDKSPGTQKRACEGFDVAVTIPPSCPSAGCGLVLDLHGALMNGDAEEAHTELRARAGAKGFIVVQPTASTRTYSGLTGPQWFNADDESLHRLVLALARDLGVDHARVHVTGFSQGGFAALRLMCKHADTFASVAAGAAGTNGCPLDESVIASCSMSGADKPSRPLDVLFLYGRQDSIVPKTCAEGVVDAIVKGFALGAPATLADDGSYTKKRYTGAGIVLDTFAHDYTTDPAGSLSLNKGHCYPGSKANSGSLWDGLACDGTNAFVWGTEVVNFFVAHPRP
jgi:polyhydroxybutyrate depolymerase